jgi:3-carboxy-cis,cis-muconate cycloisomerase
MMLPQLFLAAGSALRHAQALADNLRPDAARLDAVLASNPEVMAETASFVLAKAGVPRADAKDLVARAVSDKAPFTDALANLSPVQINWQTALDPQLVIEPCRQMSGRIFARRVSK